MIGPFSAVRLIITILRFYSFLIIGYVLLSWLPDSGIMHDIRRVLATFVEPYLGLFRRVIPPIGAIDISPIVAVLALQFIMMLLTNLRV